MCWFGGRFVGFYFCCFFCLNELPVGLPFFAQIEVFEEDVDEGGAVLLFGYFGAGSEGAVDGVGHDLFDDVGFGCGFVAGGFAGGQVEAGDLQTIEE